LSSGKTLAGTHTLTGVVTKVKTSGDKEACLTFVVGEYTQYPMYCYWLKGDYAGFLQVGDELTVTGTIKNYEGLVEFDHPTLIGYVSNNVPSTSTYTHTDFTSTHKSLFLEHVGEVIPFIPTNEYEVEYYEADGEYPEQILYYTIGNTQADFNAYRNALTGYTFVEEYVDDYGETCYVYEKGDISLDMSYYNYEGEYYIDVYVFWGEDTTGSGDSSGGNTGGGSSDSTNADLITNDGKGLPTGANGVYNVDFTKATYVKNVTDQGYYQGGCPTVGSPKVLVIPVEFSDVTANAKGYTITTLEKAFNGANGTTDYRSVHEYYYTASYGKLDLDITVVGSWFKPKYNSTYYANKTMDYYGEEVMCGDQMIMDEALAYLSKSMDLSQFDSDNNTMIDAVVLITTLDVSNASDFQWAYRYWNIYTDNDGYYYEYDGVSANDYLWASYQFLHERITASSDSDYTNKSGINTYTYIHEFGHILGADDYYDTAYVDSPMGGFDIMDGDMGDHNAFTKFNYGWLTSSRLVVANNSVTLSLEDFSKNGDTVIIANNWDENLGVYQEYFIVVYYTNNGLNSGEYGYFDENGIVVYHVNASLYKDVSDGETYYDIYYNNTDPSDEYGTEENLIEYVTLGGEYVYGVGDSLSANTKDDNGNNIAYTFTVDALTANSATLTFTKNN
jgi:M6 family metalloprotease-like protein